jgi:GNAT superfamily N-acetyltransferase
MNAALRRATRADAALLAEHRAAVWRSADAATEAELATQIPIWIDFFVETIADGTLIAFIAERDGAAIGSVVLLEQLAIPRPGYARALEGRVHSMFVEPRARGAGVARALMTMLVDHARQAGFMRLNLHPTDMARPLYRSLGFEDRDEMGMLL